MKLGNILNQERVNSMVETNAYNTNYKNTAKTQSMEKVVFSEPYENANRYYNKNIFSSSPNNCNNDEDCKHRSNSTCNNSSLNSPMFDIKSILPMLMSGKFNDMLTPLISMFGGNKGSNSGMDITKIFELFKPKSKQKKEEKKDEEISSKFDDFIIIED